MKQKPSITVISSFATDRIIRNGVIVHTQFGGPAYYLNVAFREAKTPIELVTGKKMLVDILVTDNGEFGKIGEQVSPQPIPIIKTPNIVVSTLLQEWGLVGISGYSGRVFVDIQGYVRDGRDFGKKRHWEEEEGVNSKIFCMKGTDQEIAYIPQSLLKEQKEKMLIITKGKKGVEVYYECQHYEFQPKKVVVSKHAIGAGDTFFAYFVSRFVKTDDFLQSIDNAMEGTSKFLDNSKVQF